jgi:putative tributyrin esterase
MAFCELHFFSNHIGLQTAANIILPQDGHAGRYPVMYLLHGLSDDHTIWERRTSVERYVQNLPLIVVMPNGGRGFYTDAAEGAAMETALIKDLVDYVDRMFPTKAERAGRCVGGLSMGGYGAVKLALKYPDMFCSANSHSGALAWAHKAFPANNPQNIEFKRIAGDNPGGGPNDCFALAEKIDRKKLPFLRIDCGTEDFLLQDNRSFRDHLKKLDIPHEYDEYPGSHEWGYWDKHIQTALKFHARNLGIG